ncbi:MAG: hypothetical protein DCC56_03410 [Anaerolineae bacterium]|nr:MAG: hypothetical protein DCC56_03410 [Anaerolineae bacterium]WKZ44106.1 MAG: hypothetical protein QY302_18570 [Anaerolineales bacterium]
MKKYKYAYLDDFFLSSSRILRFGCTDPKLVEEIHLELKKKLPQLNINTDTNSVSLEMNDRISKDLEHNYIEAYWWVITYFCQKGWEPFSKEGRDLGFRFAYDE